MENSCLMQEYPHFSRYENHSIFVCSNRAVIFQATKGSLESKIAFITLVFLTRISFILLGLFIHLKYMYIVKISLLRECFYNCKERKSRFSETVPLLAKLSYGKTMNILTKINCLKQYITP